MSFLSDIFKNVTNGIPLGSTGITFSPINGLGPGQLFTGLSATPVTSPVQTTTPTQSTTTIPETVKAPVFSGSNTNNKNPGGTGVVTNTKSKFAGVPEQLINVKENRLYTPAEMAANVQAVIPSRIGNADVPQYAGDTITNPNQSLEQLNKTATGLNNTANDIGTGTTDPYNIASNSGIAYSPAELTAIEKAYQGVYDPALTDVFAKIDAKQKEEQKKADDAEWKAKQIFSTNEAIRQWRATTGTKSGSGATTFTPTQTNKGAANAGMDIATFESMDPDIKNYFINTPIVKDTVTDKNVKLTETLSDLLRQVNSGTQDVEEFRAFLDEMTLPEAVKTYYINQIKVVPEEVKQGWLQEIWGGIKDWLTS